VNLMSTPVRHEILAIMETGLGTLIRTARQRRGWTQEQLADRIGVQKSYVSQWETGARKWPQEYIRPIADLLGLSQVDMAVAAGLIDPPQEAPPQPNDPIVAELIELIPYLSDEAIEVVRQLAAYGRSEQERQLPRYGAVIGQPKVATG
jgi:transcriptional regulator with XRE-family HTH domain